MRNAMVVCLLVLLISTCASKWTNELQDVSQQYNKRTASECFIFGTVEKISKQQNNRKTHKLCAIFVIATPKERKTMIQTNKFVWLSTNCDAPRMFHKWYMMNEKKVHIWFSCFSLFLRHFSTKKNETKHYIKSSRWMILTHRAIHSKHLKKWKYTLIYIWIANIHLLCRRITILQWYAKSCWNECWAIAYIR